MTVLGDQMDGVLARDGDPEESAGLGKGRGGRGFRCDGPCGSSGGDGPLIGGKHSSGYLLSLRLFLTCQNHLVN